MREATGWALIHSIWQGALIAAAFAAVLAACRAPRVRYVAGCLALLSLLAAFLFTWLHLLPASGVHSQPLLKPELPPWRPLARGNGHNRTFPDLTGLIPLLTPLWLAGVGLFYLRCTAAWLSLYNLRTRGVCRAPENWQRSFRKLAGDLKISRPVVLLESLLADTPVVLGHLRPVVLVPLGFLTGLPSDHVEAILLHELAHISRSDYLVNICQRLIEGLLFYHPAVWWISRVIRTERENCCDDVVVALSGDAHSYAVALTALEQTRTEQWAIAATGGNLMTRITRLLYPQNHRALGPPALAAVAMMMCTAMLLPAWHTNQTEATPWQKWLSEDVVYIISDQEKTAFEHLATDDERQHFIEQFWERRDPTPGTPENELKTEHYRRIAFANKHWANLQVAGWKSDRGRIYIKFGPPDEIDSHIPGGTYQRPESEGGGTVSTYPFEDWRYYHFEGIGNLTIEFVDVTNSGDLRMTLDPNEKVKK